MIYFACKHSGRLQILNQLVHKCDANANESQKPSKGMENFHFLAVSLSWLAFAFVSSTNTASANACVASKRTGLSAIIVLLYRLQCFFCLFYRQKKHFCQN